LGGMEVIACPCKSVGKMGSVVPSMVMDDRYAETLVFG
jgi:hypothetical protein